MASEADPDLAHGQLDAELVLTFTERLRGLRTRLETGTISGEQRRRWQSRLASISEGAATDLARASEQLRRLETDMDRNGSC